MSPEDEKQLRELTDERNELRAFVESTDLPMPGIHERLGELNRQIETLESQNA